MMDSDVAFYSSRFHQFRTGPYYAPHIRRILLLSDLHMDYPANQEWLYSLCTSDDHSNAAIDSKHTMIIIAGDVSHDMDILRWTFQKLKSKFGEVAFTPGNHDLWLDPGKVSHSGTKLEAEGGDTKKCRTSGKGDGCATSIDKMAQILQLCVDEDICIGPGKVGSSLWVIPLLSWHHSSFDTEPPIECWGGIPDATKVMSDYRRTAWPAPLSSRDDSVARFVDGTSSAIIFFITLSLVK